MTIKKSYRIIGICSILTTLISCKDKPEVPLVKEKVKLYIIAGTGVTASGSTLFKMQLTGTNFQTVSDATSRYIIKVGCPNGETQTLL